MQTDTVTLTAHVCRGLITATFKRQPHTVSYIYSIQNGWTPLMTASFEGNVDIVKTLINAKALLNSQEKVATLYFSCATSTHTHCAAPNHVCLLTTKLATCPWFCPQDDQTALHLAAQEGKVDVVRLLTESQAQVNIRTEVTIYMYVHVLCHVWSV